MESCTILNNDTFVKSAKFTECFHTLLTLSILILILWVGNYHPGFTAEETEAKPVKWVAPGLTVSKW